ncbi:hypothetical protein [Polyangium mundeleinium]|uniref:Macroglobulin domain-containing protein n=1 Tax=Polyangium mundeleinium TaxID=2995306 RepID=A0ABT5F695_9BACT|nr:hypothetical protein [Polyangium mundeleinium]MDC0748923.1 hypothetical protein [Polyangium mundeleinium]
MTTRMRVDKLDLAAGCYRPCEGSATVTEYEEGLCPDGSKAACGFEAGLGQLRVVVPVEVDLETKETLAPPTLTLLVDDEPTTITDGRIVEHPLGNKAVFSAVVDVPTQQAASFLLQFKVVEGYEAASTNFTIAAPALTTNLHAGASTLPAGFGNVSVGVRTPAGLQGGKLRQWIGDEPLQELDMAPKSTDPGYSEWQVSVATPSKVGTWKLQAYVGGHAATPVSVTVEDPKHHLEIVGCVDDSCEKRAGVGKADVEVETLTTVQEASLLQWIDGVQQLPVAFTKGPIIDGKQRWTFSANTLIQEGATWRFQAVAGGFSSNSRIVTIVRPGIEVGILPCTPGLACALEKGSEAILVVTAPRDITPAKASVKVTLNGIPVPNIDYPVSLDEVIGDKRVGYFTTTVPDAPEKVWRARAVINQSSSDASQPVEILP